MSTGEITAEGPVSHEFDHHHPGYVETFPEVLADLRATCPVAHTSAHGGYYVVTKYDDISLILHDDDTFSSAWTADGQRGGNVIPSLPSRVGFIDMDPPESTDYRRALMAMFTPRAAKDLEPSIKAIASSIIDEYSETGRIDLAKDFADRVPATLTLDLLGLPQDKWREIQAFLHQYVMTDPDDDPMGIKARPTNWLLEFIADEIRARRENPREDGLSWIISRTINGRTMSDDDALETVMLLIFGGFDTTASLMANTIVYLHDNPETRRSLVADPGLLRLACEEFVRFFTPATYFARTVTKDTAVGGCPLHRGDRVLLALPSANRDEAEFPRADDVDILRTPNRHFGFGAGKHRCIGSNIARSTFVVAMGELLARMPEYEVRRDQCVRFSSRANINGWISIPTTFAVGTAPAQ